MPAPASERRPLTVVFCDLVNSTEIEERIGAERFKSLLRSAFSTWQEIIERQGGRIERHMGDGVLAYFGSASGHQRGLERGPERAATAALEIVGLCTKQATTEPHDISEVAVRVGVATGVVILDEPVGEGASREVPAIGRAPNLASRLQNIAEPNCVAIAAETRELIHTRFDCQSIGMREVKGFAKPVHAWKLVRALRPQHPTLDAHSIVGRDVERGVLDESWTQVCAGMGQVVHISGDPGIGKSHLCEAFLDAIKTTASTVLRCNCSALHMNTAFYPVIEEITASAEISHADTATSRLEKLQALVRPYGPAGAALLPMLARLVSLPGQEAHPELGLSPTETRRKIIDSLVERLRLLSRRAPVVLFLEDAQWSDPSTKDFIAAAIRQIATVKVLILVTSRPELQVAWQNAADLKVIRLDRLPNGSIAELVACIDRQGALSAGTRAEIVARADGVPLFAQELTRMLGADDPRPDGMLIPATLHDSLMSQLDRLGPQAKGAAQLGAVIGRTFPYWLLSGLWWGDRQGLRDLLDDIVAARLMTRRHLGSEEHYVFEHELVRDTAYDSLLESKRKELHLQIAQIITSERTRLSDMRPELIAHHYTAAGLGHKAAVLWLEAGQLALRESANHEARSSLQSGLRCLQYLPEDQDRWRLELRLQTCLGQALIAISGHASPEVLHAFSRAHELSDRIEQVPELFTIVWGITAHHLVKGDIRRHLELSTKLLEIAQTSKDSSRLVVAHTSRTLSLYFAGRFTGARQHLNQVLDRYDWDRHRHLARTYAVDRKTITMQFGAWTLWKLGYADQAARLVEDMISHARRLGHPNSLAQALTAGASVYMLRREPDILLAKVEEGVAIAKAHGYPVWVDHADFWIGWALAEKGYLKQGIEHLNTAMEAYRRHGAGSSLPKFYGLLADRLGEDRQYDAALCYLDQAQAHIERTGERANEAETWRLRGKLLFAGNPDDLVSAEACVRRAIDIAREQEARAWELRATTTLALILRYHGRRQEARQCLAPVYGWFCEGLDTPDLHDAHCLLRELS
jgi:class 3 adenylate cyclase/tetratricopeptide (TPR) repeat protein